LCGELRIITGLNDKYGETAGENRTFENNHPVSELKELNWQLVFLKRSNKKSDVVSV
jgi:hypothetical protein